MNEIKSRFLFARDVLDLNNKVTGQIGAGGTEDVETLVLQKYLSDLWKTLERKLINCKINLILIWSVNSTIVSSTDENQRTIFEVTDTKTYVLLVSLSTQYNAKLLQQTIITTITLKSSFQKNN